MPPTNHTLADELSPRLQQRGVALSQLLQEDAHHLAEDLPEVLDFKDLAALDGRAAIDDATRTLATHELAEVIAALRRITAGSYGLCVSCGEPIPEARLRILPATPFCTGCQAQRERTGEAP